MKRKLKEKQCLDCGITFQPTGTNHKRCDHCRREEKLRIQREANVKFRLKAGKQVGVGKGGATPIGEDHPQWKTGERAFGQRMSIEYWKKTRYCERCSKDLKDAKPAYRCVHHKDHDRTNNVEENFELLCKRCHQVEHECWKAFEKSSTTSRKA